MWEIWIWIRGDRSRNLDGRAVLVIPNLRGDWKPPEVDDVWGVFKVTEVDEMKGEVTIKVADPSLLTDMP